MAHRPIHELLAESEQKIEITRSAFERLKAIDRSEYPEVAADLARDIMLAAEKVRANMCGLSGTYAGQAMRRRRRKEVA